MIKFIVTAALITGIIHITGTAAGAADCLEVLENLQIDQTDFTSDNFYFQQQIFLANSLSNQSRDTVLALPIEGLPVTLGDVKNMIGKLNESSDTSLMIAQYKQAILYNARAQSQPVREWGKCMDSRTGVRVRFEPLSGDPFGDDVLLVAEYRRSTVPSAIQAPLTLRSDLAPHIPRTVSYSDLLGCLKHNYIFQPGAANCRIKMRVPSAWAHFGLTFRFEDSSGNIKTSAVAYLPPRPKLRWEIRTWPQAMAHNDAECLHDLRAACSYAATCTGDGATVSRNVDAGFVILQNSVKCALTKIGTPNAHCLVCAADSTGQYITIQTSTGGPPRECGTNHAAMCQAAATEGRLYWEPPYQRM
jgi:hypothetical protein